MLTGSPYVSTPTMRRVQGALLGQPLNRTCRCLKSQLWDSMGMPHGRTRVSGDALSAHQFSVLVAHAEEITRRHHHHDACASNWQNHRLITASIKLIWARPPIWGVRTVVHNDPVVSVVRMFLRRCMETEVRCHREREDPILIPTTPPDATPPF